MSERIKRPAAWPMGAIIAATLLLFGTLPAHAAELRVDPPFWWQGFEQRGLQLMIYGDGIADFRARVDHRGITLREAVRTDSDNHLFVYLDIDPDLPAGSFTVMLSNGNEAHAIDYELRPRRDGDARRRGFDGSDAIYLVTPDRFANGNPANDAVEGYTDLPARNEPYGRHGGDLDGVIERLDYIADLGFTQLWLNPVLENAMPESSYHGYAITDHYRVDPRYGSNEDYRRLADAAAERGIGLIMDMVENHIGSRHPWMEDLPAADWINFDGEFTSTNHARTTNQGLYASPHDRRLMADGWFTPSMPDLNQRNRHLAEYLIQNSIWWVEYAGLAGIRQDTWPYPDKHFMSEWARRILLEYPTLNIVGEEWSLSPAIVAYWQAGNGNHDGYVSHLPSLFDFPLHDALTKALTDAGKDWGSVWTPVYETLAVDFLYPDPANLVIFPDNHDMSRIATQLNDDPALVRMALVFTATMRGIPQVFYGTEIGMTHPGTDSHGVIRSDFPGGWRGDRVNAFDGNGLEPDAAALQTFVRDLFSWRKNANVIHDGRLMQFAPEGKVYAYARYDDENLVYVVFNRGDEPARLDAAVYDTLLDGRGRARNVLGGAERDIGDTIELAPRSVQILEVLD